MVNYKVCVILNNVEKELSGYVLEYFSNIKNKNISIDYYSVYDDKYYCELFKISYIKNINTDDYNYIVLSSNDLSSLNNLSNNIYNKFILLDNIYYDINKINYNSIIPCYYGINKFDKQKEINNNSTISIVLFEDIDTSELIDKFINYNEIIFNNYNNTDIFNNNNNTDILKKADYVYIKSFNKKFVYMALSYGCNIITIDNFNNYYNLKNVTFISQSISVTKKDNIENIYDELYFYVNNRNLKIDKIIETRINDFVYNNNCYCWFSELLKKIDIKKPNIFVETGTYMGDGITKVKNDFRNVHSIELNENFYNNVSLLFSNNNNIILHLGDSAEVINNKMYNINEPVLFYLDAHFSGGETAFGKPDDNGCPVLRELEIISKRTQKDIIVIDDMRLMGKKIYSGLEDSTIYPKTLFDFRHVTMQSIKKTFTKKVLYISSLDIDRLIILCL